MSDKDFVTEVREATDAYLAAFFSARRAELRASAPEAELLCAGLEDLTMRGGAKRLRPAVMVAAQRAVRPEARLTDVVAACAGLEVPGRTFSSTTTGWTGTSSAAVGPPST